MSSCLICKHYRKGLDRNQAKGFAMAIDQRYVPAFSIEDVILDKDTGAPLSGGKVYFEQDNQRGILKPVYQITGTSPNYTFAPLPNPVILSSIGTFEDALGNPVIPYFLPYDDAGNPEYYYIRVTSANDVSQFAREAQPHLDFEEDEGILSTITNEISDPQFAAVIFDTTVSSYTYTVNTVVNAEIQIAEDWFFIVSAPAAGSITLQRITPAGSNNIVTNPGTILNINSTGLSSLRLVQRLVGSPNLWGNGYISSSFVAKTYSGTPVVLQMYYSQSDGSVVDQLLVSGTLPASGNYQAFPGTKSIPISTSADVFPDAYVEVYFNIPLNIQIDITSVMVAFTGGSPIANLPYDQESLYRQRDHLYHAAHPIVPIGTIIDFCGFPTPLHYIECIGTPLSRISFQQLFRVVTRTESVTLVFGNPNFTVANGAVYSIGMPLEGNGIPAATTILAITGNTITMSNNASLTIASVVRFFIVGNGDGSTTFNAPDLRNFVTAGSGGTYLGVGTGVGFKGGNSTHALSNAELPAHAHSYNEVINAGVGGFGFAAGTLATFQVSQTGNGPGSATPFSLAQPTALMRKFIRYQ